MRTMLIASILGIVTSALGAAPPARAASFNVTTTVDGVDAHPGDGRCATVGGACTLRAAVQEANATAGPDFVSLPPGTYLLALAGRGENVAAAGDLDITQPLTLTGAGATSTVIDGGGADRILHIIGPITVDVVGLTLRNGNVPRPADINQDGGGGAIYSMGGGRVTLRNTVVTASTGTSGGAIANDEGGTLSIINTQVTGNTGSFGGGVFNNGNLTIAQSTISGNSTSSSGGGIYHRTGALALVSSAVTGNSAGSATLGGGGVLVAVAATASIVGSALSSNTAGNGGGIHTRGTVTLSNTTISGNNARASGGAIFMGGGTTTINNATLAGNQADGEGAAISSSSAVTLGNSIVTRSGAAACSGPVTSLGYNLDASGTCGLKGPGDLSGADPQIGPLQNNGGPTPTHALIPRSPAVDAGNPATGAGGNGCEPSDQRGLPRPTDGNSDGVPRCDIGAYEASQTPSGLAPPMVPQAPPPAPLPPVGFSPPAPIGPTAVPRTAGPTLIPQAAGVPAASDDQPSLPQNTASSDQGWLVLPESMRLFSVSGDALGTTEVGERYLALLEEDGWILIVLERAPDDAFWIEQQGSA